MCDLELKKFTWEGDQVSSESSDRRNFPKGGNQLMSHINIKGLARQLFQQDKFNLNSDAKRIIKIKRKESVRKEIKKHLRMVKIYDRRVSVTSRQ